MNTIVDFLDNSYGVDPDKLAIIDDNSNMYELVKNKIEQQKNQFDLSLNKDLLIEQNDQALTSVKLERIASANNSSFLDTAHFVGKIV